MEDQVLLIEQMQELKELGIDTSKASMCWITYPSLLNKNKKTKELVINSNANKRYFYITSTAIDYTTVLEIPTFTLQDILEMLPEEIQNHKLESDLKGYIHYVFRGIKLVHNLKSIECATILEAAFNMLIYLKKNNYI